jgi:predicted ATPase
MARDVTVRSLTARNLLSFGEQPTTVELKNLNVLIGPNGSGKSNLIEVLGLLQSAPKELAAAIGKGGFIDEWLWKGSKTGSSAGPLTRNRRYTRNRTNRKRSAMGPAAGLM